MDTLQLCNILGQAFLLVLGAGCSLLALTWRLWLTTRYLKEALAREVRSSSSAQRSTIGGSFRICNELQRSLLETFLRAPVPTLRDLVESTEREFQARESARRSAAPTDWTGDDEGTQELMTRDFIQR